MNFSKLTKGPAPYVAAGLLLVGLTTGYILKSRQDFRNKIQTVHSYVSDFGDLEFESKSKNGSMGTVKFFDQNGNLGFDYNEHLRMRSVIYEGLVTGISNFAKDLGKEMIGLSRNKRKGQKKSRVLPTYSFRFTDNGLNGCDDSDIFQEYQHEFVKPDDGTSRYVRVVKGIGGVVKDISGAVRGKEPDSELAREENENKLVPLETLLGSFKVGDLRGVERSINTNYKPAIEQAFEIIKSGN